MVGTPVDYDPFAASVSKGGIPVDHDPFAEQAPKQAQIQGPPTADDMRQSAMKDQPWYARALADVAMHPEDATIRGVLKNVGFLPDIKGAAENVGNAASGVVNPLPETPQTKDLRQKIQQGTATSGDYSGAILAGEEQSPPGQLLTAATKLGGPLGLASNLIGRVNDPIASATGIDPRNLQLGEQVGGLALHPMMKAIEAAPENASRSIIGNNQSGVSPMTAMNVPSLGTASLARKVGSSVTDIGGALKGDADILSSNQLKDISSRGYNAAGSVASQPPETTNKIIDKVNSNGLQTQEEKDFDGDSIVAKTQKDFENLKNKPLSINGAIGVDKALGDRIVAQKRLGNNEAVATLQAMQGDFRNEVMSAAGDDNWKQGIQGYAAAMKMQDLEGISQAGAASDNPAKTIATGAKKST